MPPVSQPPNGASGHVCVLRTATLSGTAVNPSYVQHFSRGPDSRPRASACVRTDRNSGPDAGRCADTPPVRYAAFFSALRHLVQRSSLLVNFLWKVWPQLMQISRPLSFLPMPMIVASRAIAWQKWTPLRPDPLVRPCPGECVEAF